MGLANIDIKHVGKNPKLIFWVPIAVGVSKSIISNKSTGTFSAK